MTADKQPSEREKRLEKAVRLVVRGIAQKKIPDATIIEPPNATLTPLSEVLARALK